MGVPRYDNYHSGDNEISVDEMISGRRPGVTFNDVTLLDIRKNGYTFDIDGESHAVRKDQVVRMEMENEGDQGDLVLLERVAIAMGLV
ncbi:MAG TPA: hypothetical protein VKT27_06135 [Candidatus Binataceae bacterium]|nr:hypothetical protein [Candidatus Binataceae bacterium]